MKKISGVYKITNTITGDFYIGSSKNVKERLATHKCPSRWRRCSNNPMYLDMQKYGLDKFSFQILAEVEIDLLKEAEQYFIENLKPTYNNRRANGWNTERRKEYNKKYQKSNKYKEYKIEYYQQNREKYKEHQNKYGNQLCRYNGEVLTLDALRKRFKKSGVEHPVIEAKKYIIKD